ncbi:head GIN domain-containing protein [Pedobacter sp. L105]|uniref:head GIN domain-containing protein n=1 Tax=Pedobacter sp. L105 TaxID=1641871 RepID=UPI00131D2ECA|nr:head GIN domain-containing protein [Pedobacter sp. L105]
MRKLNMLLLLTALTFSFGANARNPVLRKMNLRQERTIGEFKGIAAGGPLLIKVTMGSKESIRMEGDQAAIADLTTEVEKGILTIKPKTKWNDWSRKYNRSTVTVYITARRITSLTMSGSGSLETLNAINSSSELVTTLSGSGSMTAIANVKSFTGVVSGSGTLALKGKAGDSNLTLSGSGNFQGKNFSVDQVSVQISGSADVYIHADQKLEAVISGSGSIRYSGNAVVKKTIIGSGSISKL